MIKLFKKDDIIQSFLIEDNKVRTTIVIGGFKVTNPTLKQFLADGWEEYTYPEPEPEPALSTIEELVESKIREKYTINQEFEVQRKRDVEPDVFQAYYAYVEECIAWAHKQPHRVDDEYSDTPENDQLA